MGQVHAIKEIRGEFAFLVNNEYTGEKTAVTVDEDKLTLFADKRIFIRHPEACPFLRYQLEDKKACCTVHHTRPSICRDYGCWRLLILNARGSRAGRIMYQRSFFSDEEDLTRLWKACIDPLDEPDDELWEEKVTRILVNAGYAVRK
jgi:Fe-S-cluster containining protein